MQIQRISNTTMLNQPVTNFTGKEKAASEVIKTTAPTLKDTFVAAKVKLTQFTNSKYMTIIRNLLGL